MARHWSTADFDAIAVLGQVTLSGGWPLWSGCPCVYITYAIRIYIYIFTHIYIYIYILYEYISIKTYWYMNICTNCHDLRTDFFMIFHAHIYIYIYIYIYMHFYMSVKHSTFMFSGMCILPLWLCKYIYIYTRNMHMYI